MRLSDLKYYFLVISISINLAHGFIPHDHEPSPENLLMQKKVLPHGFLDLLSRIFHFNPGNDHLEDYRNIISAFSFDREKMADQSILNFEKEINSEIKQIIQVHLSPVPYPQILVQKQISRGPPTDA
jgi:hypothetical protein